MALNPMDRVVRDISDIKRQLAGRSQLNHSSLENTAIPVNDEDGTERLRIGAQDDGTHAIKYVQGPPPPRPTAPSVSVDGPVVRVRWDGMLMGGHIPEDFSRIDVHFALASDDLESPDAVGPPLTTVTGAEAVLLARETGTYRVGLVAMSQSRARSEMSDVTEVEVTLVGVGDAIEAVADSANGKNKVTWSSNPPTPGDEGIAGDTWFVGEVGRPNDIVEATNLLSNPSFENGIGQVGVASGNSSGATTVTDTTWHGQGSKSIKVIPGTANSSAFYPVTGGGTASPLLTPGKTYTFSALIHLEAPQTGTIFHRARKLTIGIRDENNVANYDFATSDQAPNVPGTYRLSVTAAIPAGYQAAFLMMANGSNTVPVWFDDAVLEEGVGSGLYFDGATPDGVSENEPHYRWTGEPHASTSEKYLPALDVGDEDKWNVTEQYQHTGDEWVRIELSHRVFSTVDLAKATVGYLNGQRVEAGTIDTQQLAFGAATGDILSVDALNFKTATGLDIRGSSFRAGDAVEITEDFGIRQFGPDGALNVSLPSDGSPAEFRGDLSARTLTATGRMSIQGPGAIASGGVLELESGVVPPVAGPQITNTWDRTTFPPLTDQEAPAGLAWADGHFWRCVTTSVGLSEGGRTRIEKISPTGELVGGWDTTFRVNVDGITILNGELYVLAARLSVSGDDSTPVRPRMVVVYDLNGVEQRRWEYEHYGTGTYQPGIGNDGTNIVIAQSWANGNHTYRTYNPTTGVLVRQYDTGFQMRSNVTQILFGDFDYGDGRKKIIAQQRTDLKAFVCYNSAETAPDDAARSWNAADFQNPVGLAWDGERFHSLTPTGDLVSYQSHETNRLIGDDEDNWWGAVTWATGSQETTAGPATRFRYLHRAQLRVQNGDVPEGVEAARFYTSKGTAEPGRTDLHWRVTSEQPHEPLRITSISSFSGGTNPPATNTFTADTPGEIHSALGNFRVDGTGAGQWGPLAFHEDGTMSGIPKVAHGSVLVTGTPNVATGMDVTLPAGLFTQPPTVVATLNSGNLTSARNIGITPGSTTTSAFRIVLLRDNDTGTYINWVATGE